MHSENQMNTIRVLSPGPSAQGGRDALLVHIYPTGPDMGSRYRLGSDRIVIGRGENCDVRVNDTSVSRRHACIEADQDGFAITDLQSLNGIHVNNAPVAHARLRDGDYLRVGNRIYRFLAGGNIEAEYHEVIYRLTIIDALTDTYNKRYLLEFLDRELARAARRARPLSLILFDIDHFKKVNDELGHLAGDHVLRELSDCVKGVVRKDELFARYGGEEFAVVLPETCCPDAAALADRVRAQVEAHPFYYDGERLRITISLGVATAPGASPTTAAELIAHADESLYAAKREGRNRVRAWAPVAEAEAPVACSELLAGRAEEGAAPEAPALADAPRDRFVAALASLVRAVESRDPRAVGHSGRVARCAVLLAEALGLGPSDRALAQTGALLHDIGTIALAAASPYEPGQLTAGYVERTRAQVLGGVAILEPIPGLAPLLPILRHQQERWDGRGYPDGLGGEQIPLLARIVAAADAFDSITSFHAGRADCPVDEALAELSRLAGSHLDPSCVQTLTRLRPRLEATLASSEGEPASVPPGLDDLSQVVRRALGGVTPPTQS